MNRKQIQFELIEWVWLKRNIERALTKLNAAAEKKPATLKTSNYEAVSRLFNTMNTENRIKVADSTIFIDASRRQIKFVFELAANNCDILREKVIPEYKDRIEAAETKEAKEKLEGYLDGVRKLADMLQKLRTKMKRCL